MRRLSARTGGVSWRVSGALGELAADLGNRRLEVGQDLIPPRGALRFSPEHDHRLGVRGPDKPPAVREAHPGAVYLRDRVPLLKLRDRPRYELELLLFRAVDADLGRRVGFRQILKRAGEAARVLVLRGEARGDL